VPFTVTRLALHDFRNYEDLSLTPGSSLTILLGPNGVGKTNVIEAIELLTEGESFRRPAWSDTVRWGAASAELVLEAEDGERRREVRLSVAEPGRRSYSVNGKKKRSVSEVAGTIPCVVFTPDDLRIIKDSAERRRAAVDDIGVQLSRTYGRLRNEYEQVVRQRNALLKEDRVPKDIMSSWDERLVTLGALLVTHRRGLTERIAAEAKVIHARLTDQGELDVRYVPSWERDGVDASSDDPRSALEAHLIQKASDETARRTTLVGPHRDEVSFSLGGKDARLFASQGQQRTVALAFKLAEVAVVTEVSGSRPLLLLDDVMSELDESRRATLATLVGEATQTFVTTTNLGYFTPELIERATVIEL